MDRVVCLISRPVCVSVFLLVKPLPVIQNLFINNTYFLSV